MKTTIPDPTAADEVSNLEAPSRHPVPFVPPANPGSRGSGWETSNLEGPPPWPVPFGIALLIVVALIAAAALTGCVETTTTAKDGSVTTTKAPAPGVLRFAGAAITAYSPRPIVVREEKSGRITLDEIERRWKP